ncbi:hypothetical protein cypCar_00025015, partial [Cyprinus carpio]
LGFSRNAKAGWSDRAYLHTEKPLKEQMRDLRNNLISTIMPGAFLGLTALRKLDLSSNRIGCLTSEVFQGLTNLTKLNISGNIFSSLDPHLFMELHSLKLVNFHSEFLSCDCGLRWVPGFFHSSSARLGDETLCAYPRRLQNKPLRLLRETDLSCEGPLELHTLSLLPSLRQVVFKGDRLPFHCTASLVDKITALHWRHNGQPVTTDPTSGVHLEESVQHDCTFITRWPRTLAGITSYQHCLQLRYPSLTIGGGVEEKKASRNCDRSGRWEEGDYSQCLYTNDITRVLHTFILVITLAHQVRSYTLEAAGFTDTVDVLYVAQMMHKFMDYVTELRELSELLVEMGSNLMQVDDQILARAQREERACSSVVYTLETLAWPQLHSHAQDFSKNAVALASVSLPASLFPLNAPPDCKLQFVAFRNGRFFPFTSNFTGHSDLARRRGVNTPVIYVGLGVPDFPFHFDSWKCSIELIYTPCTQCCPLSRHHHHHYILHHRWGVQYSSLATCYGSGGADVVFCTVFGSCLGGCIL